MKIGIHVPQWGSSANREGVITVAQAIEENGFDSAWVADHIVLPVGDGSQYPYHERTPFTAETGILEGLTVLSVVAGATHRIRLGTSVLVAPMRETLLAAKTLGTLDILSGGRVVVGVGAGWLRGEFEALGAQFDMRGARLDEQVPLLRRLWSEATVAHTGRYLRFDEISALPLPVQRGGPPIIIGGMGKRALKRAGVLGDGWHATGVHEKTLRGGFAEVRRHAEAAGRDSTGLTLSTSTLLPSDDDVALKRLDRLRRIGVNEVVLKIEADIPEICDVIVHARGLRDRL